MTQDGARGRAIVVLAAALIFAAAPFAVDGFGGFDPGRFPVPQVDPPVQPAGWAFSIWGLIYVWLIAHAGYGLLRRDTDPAWDRMRLPAILALVVGAAWLPVAQQSPLMATLLIVVMLAGAVVALMRAPVSDFWWAAVPFGLFSGWLTAATGVSIGLLLAGWGLLGPVTAALVALVWTALMAAAVLGLRPELAYALAAAWAMVGIVAANGLVQPLVSVVAAAAAIGLPAFAVYLRRRT